LSGLLVKAAVGLKEDRQVLLAPGSPSIAFDDSIWRVDAMRDSVDAEVVRIVTLHAQFKENSLLQFYGIP
jgi:hypothetical protein